MATPSFAGTQGGRHEPGDPEGLELQPAVDARLLLLPRSELRRRRGDEQLPDAGGTSSIELPPSAGPRALRLLRDLASTAEAEPAERLDVFRPESVFGDDDRRPLTDAGSYPWRAICHLRISAADGATLLGTGWLAGPRLVATAGHCVFQPERGGWARSIEVTPGRSAADPPARSFDVGRSGLRSVEGWTRRANHDFDYGAIVLPPPGLGEPAPGDRVGYFGFAAPTAGELLQRLFNLAGFPDDARPPGTLMWHARSLDAVNPNTLLYTIDTKGGQSGAPLWRLVDGSPQVVGIHSGERNRANQAVRINAEVHFNLATWKRLAA